MHVKNLLALRDGTPAGEMEHRGQILRLLGAVPVQDLEPPPMVRKVRRVEGVVRLPPSDGRTGTTGLVVFAVGGGGAGALADVRNKDGGIASARSLLVENPDADFVLLLTTGEPPPAVLDLARSKSRTFLLGDAERHELWVMGLPEVVARADRFVRDLELPGPWWRRVLRGGGGGMVPPLLLG